jgi:hypothetical protein
MRVDPTRVARRIISRVSDRAMQRFDANRRPLLTPPVCERERKSIKYLFHWRATVDEDWHYCFAVAL